MKILWTITFKAIALSLCNIEKVINFTIFCSKTIHVSLFMTRYMYIIVTITHFIYTISITFYFIILVLFSLLFHPHQILSLPLTPFNIQKRKRDRERVCVLVGEKKRLFKENKLFDLAVFTKCLYKLEKIGYRR